MLKKATIFLLALASTASAAVIERAACNADNCLRSLRATQYATRLPQASIDCHSILDVYVTLPTVTETKYSTTAITNTATLTATNTNTFFDTATSVQHDTFTTDTTSTSTITERLLEKRSAIVFPTYASWCSGIVRFSSACSCIGATANTITVAAPTETITLPHTDTSSASITNTVETSITITDATRTVTTYDSTSTRVSMATVGPMFKLEVYKNGIAQRQYASTAPEAGGGFNFLMITTDISQARVLRLLPNGNCWWGDKIMKGPTYGGAILMWWGAPEFLANDRTPYVVTMDPANGNELTFSTGGHPGKTWWPGFPNNQVSFQWLPATSAVESQIITFRPVWV